MIILNHIDKNEALRYMGCNSHPDTALASILDKCEAELLEVIIPRYTWKCFDITRVNNNISLDGCALKLIGNDISEHLEGCEKAVLICATLSDGTDRLIRQKSILDMSEAFAADALASAAIEQFCCLIDEEIKQKFPEYFMTWRFSPGYGDFPIEIQKYFLDVTDANKRIGLNASESSILMPRKSVTAVAGLSKNSIPSRRRGCASCNMSNTCQYKKRGEHCGF